MNLLAPGVRLRLALLATIVTGTLAFVLAPVSNGRMARLSAALFAYFAVAAALLPGPPAIAAAPDSSVEAADLIAAMDANLKAPGDWLRPRNTKLPPGDYALCQLHPRIIYANMIGGADLQKPEIRAGYRGWKEYVVAVSATLMSTRVAPSLTNLSLRAKLDREIRAAIGKFGHAEPRSAASKHYQALLWSTSCLIDRANTHFVRNYLASGKWPSKGNPDDPASPSHSLFLLLQHAVLTEAEREKLVPWVEEALVAGAIAPFDYARIVDRSTQSRLRYQKYGTQISFLDGMKVIEDAEGCRTDLNASRSALGLSAIEKDVQIRLRSGATCDEP